jgi:hypothetical protein
MTSDIPGCKELWPPVRSTVDDFLNLLFVKTLKIKTALINDSLYLLVNQFRPETNVIILIGKLACRSAGGNVFPVERLHRTDCRCKILQTFAGS